MQRSRSKDVVAAIDKKLLRRSRSKDVVSTSTPTQVSRRSKSKDVVSSTQLSHRSRSKDNVSFTDTSRSSLSLSTGKRGSSRANPPRATSTGSKSPYHRPPPGMSMGAAAVGTSPRRPASTVPTSSSMPPPPPPPARRAQLSRAGRTANTGSDNAPRGGVVRSLCLSERLSRLVVAVQLGNILVYFAPYRRLLKVHRFCNNDLAVYEMSGINAGTGVHGLSSRGRPRPTPSISENEVITSSSPAGLSEAAGNTAVGKGELNASMKDLLAAWTHEARDTACGGDRERRGVVITTLGRAVAGDDVKPFFFRICALAGAGAASLQTASLGQVHGGTESATSGVCNSDL